MPAIQTPAKVLVTGANGYLGMWIIRTLLEHGFAVRAAVRSADKTAFITNTFKDHKDMVEFAIVEDITKDGAFNEAVKGVDAIHHVASPVVRETDDPQKILQPAIRGTVGILESALKFGPSVKRVILTSSVAAISQLSRGPATYSEKDWNDESEAEVERLGDKISTNSAYRASKTLAEKAAWKFCEDHKHEIGWDLVSINPPFLYGPGIHDVSTPDSLNSTANEWYRSLLEDGYPNSLTNKTAWVDVRDVAEAQVRALEREGREASASWFLQGATCGRIGVCVRLASIDPLYLTPHCSGYGEQPQTIPLPNHTIPVGTPGSGKGAVYKNEYDTSKCLRILGMEYRTMEQTTRDTLADFARRGW
ncbi:D-lactaldehyde dehydrogenase [Infundibulicybe gibba]|nr:D-lactaldehyde dehydrogenase [Infundibulicybe gibba]